MFFILVGWQVCVAGVRGRSCSDMETSSSTSSHSSSPLLHSNTSRRTSQCLVVCFMWPLGGSILSRCWEDGGRAGCSMFFFFHPEEKEEVQINLGKISVLSLPTEAVCTPDYFSCKVGLNRVFLMLMYIFFSRFLHVWVNFFFKEMSPFFCLQHVDCPAIKNVK